VVVTTNFDHLVSDALTQFTTKEPVVVGHEGLASLVRPNLTRPLIVKIHRDLFYDPHSSPEKVNRLHEKWVGPLKQLLQFYSPIVIGYGGNDGSLMGLLEELSANEIAGRIHWCYREADGPPGKRILRVLKKTHGVLVPIIGFDELMLQLAQEMGVPLVDQQLDEVARVRGARLKTELEGIRTRLLGSEASESDTVLNALEKGLERQLERQDDWWAWSLKAKACSDPEERVNVYSTAVERLPRSAELRMGLALALLARGDRQEAEDAAMQAYGLDRRLALDFARVHARVSNDPNVVRAAFDAALDQAPEDASASAEYAEWLGARGDAQAALMFETALDLDPKHVFGLARYAQFLYRSSRYEEARGFAQRAWASLAPRPEQLAAEMAFLLAVLATRREEDPKSALARVKAILEDGMRQVDLPRLVGQPRWWSSMHDPSLTKLAKWLDLWGPTKSSFAGDATWQELEPIPADEPWPEENFRV
jgi:tetratricopeptide (TPR) repeat protein